MIKTKHNILLIVFLVIAEVLDVFFEPVDSKPLYIDSYMSDIGGFIFSALAMILIVIVELFIVKFTWKCFIVKRFQQRELTNNEALFIVLFILIFFVS